MGQPRCASHRDKTNFSSFTWTHHCWKPTCEWRCNVSRSKDSEEDMDGVLLKLLHLQPERGATEASVLCDFATFTSWEAACAREAKNGVYSQMRDTLLPETKLVGWIWVKGPFMAISQFSRLIWVVYFEQQAMFEWAKNLVWAPFFIIIRGCLLIAQQKQKRQQQNTPRNARLCFS